MKRGSQHGFVRTLSVGGRLDRFVGVTRRNSYPQQTRMDYLSDFYAASPDLVEHSLMSNNIYDSSPTSLYMYEQEKVDMQNTLGNICSNVIQEVPTKKSKNEDFELKSQYEMSQDLCLNLGDSVQHESLPSNKESWQAGHLMCEKSTDIKLESFEPTLAELNTYSEENSLMSIGNLTELIGGSAAQSAENSNSDFIKSEPVISGCTWDNNAIIDTDREKQSLKVSAVKNWMLQTQTKGLQPLNDTDDHELKPELKGQPVELLALLGSTRGYSNKGVLPSSSRGQSCTTSTATRGKDTQALTSPTIGKSPDVSSATNVTKSSMPSQTFPTQVASLLSQLVPSGGKTLSPQVVSEESNSVDRKWEEIKHFLYDQEEKDIAKGQQTRSKRRSIVSQSSTISNEDSDDSDWDMQGVESDSESDGSQADWTTSQSTSKKPMHKDKQYFWQYNIQSKGPKGKRVNFGMDNNPHKLQGFEDPVFDTVTASQLGTSIKHGGKARKGDGNDIKPNPKKLVQIGTQLKRLNKQINGFVPLSELPASNRSKSKKEKNKLASRACRLKKKAQHEANKVKLHGLDCEHKQLLHVVSTLKQSLQKAVDESEAERKAMSYTSKLESLMEEYLTTRVAGSTTDYVNQVIKRVEEGDATGGLDLKRHH